MRRVHRTDQNQQRFVATLRAAGASVLILLGVGDGCPDLLAGINGSNYLIEVKNGQGKFTPMESVFLNHWRGQVTIVRDEVEALFITKRLESDNLHQKGE